MHVPMGSTMTGLTAYNKCSRSHPFNDTFVHQTHRLVDMGTPIAAGVAEKPEHILRKPASRRASRGLVDRQEDPTSSADGPTQLLSGFGRCCPWSVAL